MIQQQGGGGDTYPDDREQLRGVMNKPTVMQRKIICRYGRGRYKKKLSYKKKHSPYLLCGIGCFPNHHHHY